MAGVSNQIQSNFVSTPLPGSRNAIVGGTCHGTVSSVAIGPANELIIQEKDAGQAHDTAQDQEWYSAESLAAFDGRVVYFNCYSDSFWEYGIVHFSYDHSYINLAIKYDQSGKASHSAVYPVHHDIEQVLFFRPAQPEEYQNLAFSYEDLRPATSAI